MQQFCFRSQHFCLHFLFLVLALSKHLVVLIFQLLTAEFKLFFYLLYLSAVFNCKVAHRILKMIFSHYSLITEFTNYFKVVKFFIFYLLLNFSKLVVQVYLQTAVIIFQFLSLTYLFSSQVYNLGIMHTFLFF